MAKVNPSYDLHKQMLDWAHEKVRTLSDERASGEQEDRWTLLKSKLGFAAAVVIGALTAGWSSLVGIGRTAELRLIDRGAEEAEDAWEKANSALQTVFDGLTGIVDSTSILTRQEIKNIAAISTYGKHLAELNNISPDVRKTLTEQLKKAQLYVKKGGDGAGQDVSNLFKVFDTVKESPTGAAEKLKNLKWTRQK